MIISAWWLRTNSKLISKKSKKQGAVHKRSPHKLASYPLVRAKTVISNTAREGGMQYLSVYLNFVSSPLYKYFDKIIRTPLAFLLRPPV